MKKNIFKTILITSITISISAFLMSSFIIYNQAIEKVKMVVFNHASTLKEILDNNPNYLTQNNLQSNLRITLIDKEGFVLYDNFVDTKNLDNHLLREEVQEAINKKQGYSIRDSNTTNTKYIYFATILKNNNIIRVSYEFNTLSDNLKVQIILVFLVIVILLIICLIFSSYKINQIIKPINTLDLQNPLNNKTYPELRELLESLETHNNLRKEFSANVSHELKTPLTSISGYAEIMANNIAKIEDHQAISKKIYDEAQRLLEKINNIIKISKLDENKVDTDFTQINYKNLILEIVNNLQSLINKNNLKLELELEEITGNGISSLIFDAIYNIIQNSIKYNKPNGLIKIKLHQLDNNIYIRIKDTGIGIDKEEIPRIFERFYRVDKSRSQIIEGSGLGLAISKHAILLHNGKINVYSKINEGSTFEIIIPK